MEKLKEARELHGFRNAWTNDGKIFCKSEDNENPQLASLQMASVELGEKKKLF